MAVWTGHVFCIINPAGPLDVVVTEPSVPSPPSAVSPGTQEADTNEVDMDTEWPADIDDGVVNLPLLIGPDTIPNRRRRLRLRERKEDEEEAACAAIERLGATLAAKITDAADWDTVEGYITALPYLVYEHLQPYTATETSAARPQTRRKSTGHPTSHSRNAQVRAPSPRIATRPPPGQGWRPPRNSNFNRASMRPWTICT
ncbi:unnamed protein product [Phytophthora fragariaefolia]|uniref:Unnamed protein product n=1 Tax=Phytophthora fragariaefolia TaxID=1490495 RepID=A0A9W6XPH7_9STRA|nr:unnamed protein product [Phytophthora fragariaefolia]